MDTKEKLKQILDKRGYYNTDLITEIEELYKQDKDLQLQQGGVNDSLFKCNCLRPQANCFSGKCSYYNRTIVTDITTDDL